LCPQDTKSERTGLPMLPFKKNEKYASIAFYAFLTITAAAAVFLCIYNFKEVIKTIKTIFALLSPFTYGFIVAYLCNPIMCFYERTILSFKKAKRNMHAVRRALSLILTLLTAIAVISVILYAIVPQVAQSFEDLGSQMNIYIENVQTFADDLVREHSGKILGEQHDTLASLLAEYNISLNIKDLFTQYYTLIQSGANYVISYGGALIGEVKNFVIGVILALYFLYSKEKLCAQLKKILSALFKRRTYLNTVRLARFTHETFGGFIVGKLLDSFIIGLLSLLVFWLCNIPYYPLLSVIVGITNIVPFFGPIIGGFICCLLILIVAPADFLWVLIIVVAIQQIDGNILGPKILGNSIGISSLWVIISITAAGSLFGFAGMVLGVPVTAVLYVLFKQFIENRLRHKNAPVHTEFYKTDPPYSDVLDPGVVFIDKDTPVPELTREDDIPDPEPKQKKSGTEILKKAIKKTEKKVYGRKRKK